MNDDKVINDDKEVILYIQQRLQELLLRLQELQHAELRTSTYLDAILSILIRELKLDEDEIFERYLKNLISNIEESNK